jgi:predicted kinase
MQQDYNYVFDNYFNALVQPIYEQELKHFQSQGLNFVIDRTHVTEASRKRTLRAIGSNYRKFAVYTPASGIGSLMANIDNRVKQGGHAVPEDVVNKFLNDYRTPTYTEGFDMIFSSSGFERLLQFMDFKDDI